jgi:hypothetical protein
MSGVYYKITEEIHSTIMVLQKFSPSPNYKF